MVFKSDSNQKVFKADVNDTLVLATASSVSPVSELNELNRVAICKTATVVHVQRNDQIKAENSHRWLMFLVEGTLTLRSGKDEVGSLNAGSKEALNPLFFDRGAHQNAQTGTMAKIVRFGREQLDILLKEQQKNAISVMDVDVGELDNLVFDDIIKVMSTGFPLLASSSDASVKILRSYVEVAGIPELAEIIQCDPGLAMHIVTCANKVDVGAKESTSSIRGAITRLGVKETNRYIIELLRVSTMVPANEIIENRFRRYIDRSTLSASIVQVLSRKLKHLKPEVAMLVSMSADIGELMILTHANTHADKFTSEHQLSSVIEKLRVIVSAWLISHWNFPTEIVDACYTSRDWYRTHNGEITYTDLVTAALLIIQSEMPEAEHSSIPAADNLLLARRLQQAGIDLTSPGEIVKAATNRIINVRALLKAS